MSLFQDDPTMMYLGPRLPYKMKTEFNVLDLEDMIPTPVAMAFPPDSELRTTVNTFLMKIREIGILDKLRRKWMPVLSDNNKDEEQSATVLGFENLVFPFLCLASGLILSLSVAFVEKVRGSMRRPFPGKNRQADMNWWY